MLSSRGSNTPPSPRLIGELQRYASELRNSTICTRERPQGGVYGMWNPATARFDYVGRTVNLNARQKQQEVNPRFEGLKFKPLATTDVRVEQRGLEQSFMNLHGTGSLTGRPSLNQIRRISSSNPSRGLYEGAAAVYHESNELE